MHLAAIKYSAAERHCMEFVAHDSRVGRESSCDLFAQGSYPGFKTLDEHNLWRKAGFNGGQCREEYLIGIKGCTGVLGFFVISSNSQ